MQHKKNQLRNRFQGRNTGLKRRLAIRAKPGRKRLPRQLNAEPMNLCRIHWSAIGQPPTSQACLLSVRQCIGSSQAR